MRSYIGKCLYIVWQFSVKSITSLVWARGTYVCARYVWHIIKKSTLLNFEESLKYFFFNKLRYFTWQMMSTDWDSLLQDVAIRYSKLAGIDGLLVVDKVNHDDVMTWRIFLRYWPFVRESTSQRWWIPLCAFFRSHWWIQTGVTVRKRPI